MGAPPLTVQASIAAGELRMASSDDSSASHALLREAAPHMPVCEDGAPPLLCNPQPQDQQQGKTSMQTFRSKHEAAARVKDLLRLLLARPLVTRAQFIDAARMATNAILEDGTPLPRGRPTKLWWKAPLRARPSQSSRYILATLGRLGSAGYV